MTVATAQQTVDRAAAVGLSISGLARRSGVTASRLWRGAPLTPAEQQSVEAVLSSLEADRRGVLTA